MGIVDGWAFVVASILLILSPGPGTLAILGAAMTSRRDGFAALAGTSLGDALLMFAAAAGAAAVLHGNPLAFQVLRYGGGAYLAWLGWKSLRASTEQLRVTAPAPGQALRRSLMVTLFNPKAIVFFMAFFPQFIAPDAGWQAFALLGAGFIAMNCTYQTALIVMAGQIARHMTEVPAIARWINRSLGVVFIGFGVKLALF